MRRLGMLVGLVGMMAAMSGVLGEEIATKPASGPATAPAVGKNLVTVKGVTLTKTAKTEEEEEEQEGMGRGFGNFSMSSSLFGGTTMEVTGSPEYILRTVAPFVTDAGRVFVNDGKLPKGEYHLVISGARSGMVAKLAASYGEAFGVKMVNEARERDAMVLAVDAEKIKGLAKVTGFSRGSSSESNGDHSKLTINGTFEDLRRNLERELKVPVVDETKDTGSYTILVEWSNATAKEDLAKALGEKGIKLTMAKRKVEGIQVDAGGAETRPGEGGGK